MFRSEHLNFIRVLLFLGVVALTAVPTHGHRLTQGEPPLPDMVMGYPEAFCSSVSGGFRVCKVRVNEKGGAMYVIVNDSKVLNSITAPFWETADTSPDGFFAYRGDLDQNGKDEIVLVSLESVTQGMGITFSTVYIFDGETFDSFGTPISFSVEEFGEHENFIYDVKRGRTEILITFWAYYDSIERKRRPGHYLVGKWFSYKDKKLLPNLEKPTFARRFLNSFAAERDNSWFQNRRPFKWLMDRRAHRFFGEPGERAKQVITRFATIRSLGSNNSIEFATNAGDAIKGKIQGGYRGISEDSSVLQIKSIGLWKQRYTYPFSSRGRFDAAAFFSGLEGRRVRLETYFDEFSDEYTNLWLLD